MQENQVDAFVPSLSQMRFYLPSVCSTAVRLAGRGEVRQIFLECFSSARLENVTVFLFRGGSF